MYEAAKAELQAARSEWEAEEAMERASSSAQRAAQEALEQWEVDEKKLDIARRRQKSKRPTPAREWPTKEEYLVRRVEISKNHTMALVHLNDSCKAKLALHYQEKVSRGWREKAEALEARLAAAERSEHEAQPKRKKK